MTLPRDSQYDRLPTMRYEDYEPEEHLRLGDSKVPKVAERIVTSRFDNPRVTVKLLDS